MAFEDYGADAEYYVYHERQLNDSNLCAVHCVNNLLQYPYFDVQTCEHYVQQLKQKERQMLMTDADPNLVVNDNMLTEYVSPDGNYSIEVIKYALATDMFNLSMHRWGTQEGEIEKPHELTGFICHFKNHWIALRKLYGQWYDLNSLSGLPETLSIPCTMSDFYLSAHLGTLKEQGYSIFAVTGAYPPLHPKSELEEFEMTTKWNDKIVHTVRVYKASELKTRGETYPKNLLQDVNRSNVGQSVGIGAHGGSEEYMLQQAMQASMQGNDFDMGDVGAMGALGAMGDDDDAELQQVLAMSMQSNANNNNNNNSSSNNSSSKPNVGNFNNNNNNNNNSSNGNGMEMDENEELAHAMFMSMQGDFESKVPEEPEKTDGDRVEINLKLLNGNQVQRGFKKDNTLGDVSNYVKSVETINVLNDELKFVLPPRDTYTDLSMKLSELGGRRIRLIVQKNVAAASGTEKEKKSSDDSKENDNNDNDKDTVMNG